MDDMTAQEMLAAWDAGQSVWSVEMGGRGLGPDYEQCIQLLTFEIIRDEADTPMPDKDDPRYATWGDAAVTRLAGLGFSGAQVGAAQHLASQLIRKGLKQCAAEVPDRMIQARKHFPAPPTTT